MKLFKGEPTLAEIMNYNVQSVSHTGKSSLTNNAPNPKISPNSTHKFVAANEFECNGSPAWFRVILFADYSKTVCKGYPSQRILFDSAVDTSQTQITHLNSGNSKSSRTSRKTKDYRFLFEMAFGNLDLAHKCPGSKIHILKASTEILHTEIAFLPLHEVIFSSVPMYRLSGRPASGFLSRATPSVLSTSAPHPKPFVPHPVSMPIPIINEQDLPLPASLQHWQNFKQRPSSSAASSGSSSAVSSLAIPSPPGLSFVPGRGGRSAHNGTRMSSISSSLSSNNGAEERDNLLCSALNEAPTRHQLVKVGLCALFRCPEALLLQSRQASTPDSTFNTWCALFFHHMAFFQAQLNRLKFECCAVLSKKADEQGDISSAAMQYEEFLASMRILVRHRATQLERHLVPLLNPPACFSGPSLWMNFVQASTPTTRALLSTSNGENLERKLCNLFCSALDSWHNKDANYFLASLLTAVLTAHPTWVHSVYPHMSGTETVSRDHRQQHHSATSSSTGSSQSSLLSCLHTQSECSLHCWEPTAQCFGILREPAQCVKIVLMAAPTHLPAASASSASSGPRRRLSSLFGSSRSANIPKQDPVTQLECVSNLLTYFIRCCVSTVDESCSLELETTLSHSSQRKRVVNLEQTLLGEKVKRSTVSCKNITWAHVQPLPLEPDNLPPRLIDVMSADLLRHRPSAHLCEGVALQTVLLGPSMHIRKISEGGRPRTSQPNFASEQSVEQSLVEDLRHVLRDCEGFPWAAIEASAVLANLDSHTVKVVSCRGNNWQPSSSISSSLGSSGNSVPVPAMEQIVTPSALVLSMLDNVATLLRKTNGDSRSLSGLLRQCVEHHLRLMTLRGLTLLHYCCQHQSPEVLQDRQHLAVTLQIDPSDLNLLLAISAALTAVPHDEEDG